NSSLTRRLSGDSNRTTHGEHITPLARTCPNTRPATAPRHHIKRSVRPLPIYLQVRIRYVPPPDARSATYAAVCGGGHRAAPVVAADAGPAGRGYPSSLAAKGTDLA